MNRRHCVSMWTLRVLWAIGLAITVFAFSDGRLLADGPKRTYDYHQTVLKNGLRVITLEDFSSPIVAVHLWYHVGSKNEDPKRQGFAHMFEHMMFRGTDKLGSTGHFDLIHKVGGNCNAHTTFDQTVYIQTLPANQLELALWLEAERMSMLKIDQEAFDTERKVVEEERRMGLNRPYGQLMEKVLPYVFPGHPYRWSTIGSIPHLRATSVPELRAFWQRYYVPNNATLVIVGAVKTKRADQLAEKYFGWIPRCDDVPQIPKPVNKPFEPREITIKERNAPAPIVALLFRGVPAGDDDSIALDLMTGILGGGESSRIYRKLVAEDQSAVFALAASMQLEQSGVCGAGAVLSPMGSNPDKVLETLKAEVRKMGSEPVTKQELVKARNQMLKSLVVENLTVVGKAEALGSAAVLEDDVSQVNSRIDRIRSVTPKDIQRVARTYFDLEHALTLRVQRNLLGALGGMFGAKQGIENVAVTGKPETNPPAPGRPGVSRPKDYIGKPPIAGRLRFDMKAKVDKATLGNGMTVIVVENHEVPFISANLGLLAGAWTESKPGTASMAMQMLTLGTAHHSEKELADELAEYAISLAGGASMDTSNIVMSCLPEQLNRAVDLLAEVTLSPTMPEEEFTKLLRQIQTGLVVQSKEPGYLADLQLKRRIYGDHPYGRNATGTLKDLNNLTRDDLKTWWTSTARPDSATLIFAGDIDMTQALAVARKHFGAWHVDGDAPGVKLPEIPTAKGTHIFLVDYPGGQSQIRVGQIGLTRKDPGYFVSRVVSGYFGGAFGSRLNETIRVKKGLTYGARGGFAAKRFSGRFFVSTFSKTSTTVDAVRAIFEEINRLRNEPPTPKELSDTISYTLGSFPASRETPQQVAGEIWLLRYSDLPDDYIQQLLAGVAGTTAEDCSKLAKGHVHPKTMVVVVVGSAKKLKAGLSKIAPVTVIKP